MLCTGARHRYLKPNVVRLRWQACHVGTEYTPWYWSERVH